MEDKQTEAQIGPGIQPRSLGKLGTQESQWLGPMAVWLDGGAADTEKCSSAVAGTLRTDSPASPSLVQELLGPAWKAGQPPAHLP